MVSVCGFDKMAMVKGILGLVAMVLALNWLCVPRLRSFPPILHVLVVGSK